MSQITTITSALKIAALAAAATVATASASRAAAVPAVPGLTPGINNVTSVTTRTDAGIQTSVNNVTGANLAGNSFVPTNKYTVNYGGDLTKILTINAGGTSYAATGLANNVVRRFVGANNDMLWYTGNQTGFTNGSSVNLNGPALSGFTQAFDQNAINVGADNLFVTKATAGNPVGNNTNVDRVDLLFTAGVAAQTNSMFMISDRGDAQDHDVFAVAAITSLDSGGNPSSYGPLFQFNHGTWGTTDIAAATEEVVLRKNDNIPGDTLHPSDFVNQAVGGVAISTATLAGNTGSTIYGYSLFSGKLNVTGDGSGTQLVNWTDASVYQPADYTSTGGGLDPSATIAVLYTGANTNVPEPTTATLAAAGASSLLLSRRRKGASRRGA